jgi:predicted short-subunit dehydrogenase-like oxidoreductase (DUF2520 family)
MKIILIGSGNVATHFGKALKASGHSILQVYSRSESSAKSLAKKLSCSYTTDIKKISDKADLFLIAVKDEGIRSFLLKFAKTSKTIVHTSGSVSLKVFGKKFKNCGVVYPVQTFSIHHKVNFKNVPVCIEATNTSTRKKITSLVKTVTGEIHYMNSSQRRKIHLAAVFANNFSNHLFAIAENILAHERISFDLLRPLILETAMKIQQHSPLEMQTGPARRGDSSVIEEHLKMLVDKKQFREIYQLISESISEMSGIRL